MAGIRRASKVRSEKAAARQPERKPWKARRRKVRLFQGEATGEWFIAGRSGIAIRATDWEVSLWLEVCELRTQVAVLRRKVAEMERIHEAE